MARSHSHIIGAGRTTPPPPGAGGDRLVLTALGATALLVTPIALWARFGDANVVRTIAIATASIILSGGLVYLVRRPRYPVFDPSAPHEARCRAEARHVRPLSRPAARMRVGSPASTYRTRPPRRARPSRDLRCRSAARRTARRRTRP